MKHGTRSGTQEDAPLCYAGVSYLTYPVTCSSQAKHIFFHHQREHGFFVSSLVSYKSEQHCQHAEGPTTTREFGRISRSISCFGMCAVVGELVRAGRCDGNRACGMSTPCVEGF